MKGGRFGTGGGAWPGYESEPWQHCETVAEFIEAVKQQRQREWEANLAVIARDASRRRLGAA